MRMAFRARAQGGVTPREVDRREAALRASLAGDGPKKRFPPSLFAVPIDGSERPLSPSAIARLAEAAQPVEVRAAKGAAIFDALSDLAGRAAEGESHQHETPRSFLPPSDLDIPMPGGAAVPPPDNAFNLPRIIRDDGAPVDVWVKTEDGIKRWRPIVDCWRVGELPDGGRLIEISGGRPLRLDGELAAHFSWLLMPEEWRIALGEKLGVAG